MEFSSEQLRGLVNASQLYDELKAVQVPLSKLPGGMYWRVINSREYLYQYYRVQSGKQHTKSLGPRSETTESLHAEFSTTKQDLAARCDGIEARIKELAPVWRALRLPSIDRLAGNILRAFDQTNFGRHVLTIGTYALKAYEVEANTIFSTGLDATDDLDFTIFLGAPAGAQFSADSLADASGLPRQLLLTLKQVDPSFIVSTTSAKTVVNNRGYLVDLLCTEADARLMSGAMPWKPESLIGQDWLQLGRPVRQTVIDFQGWPVPLDVPDPRYFALHKLWLGKQSTRSAAKRPKDQRQGAALLRVVKDHMPHYPLDEAFVNQLPAALRNELEAQRND